MVEIIGFIQQNSEAAVSQKHGVSQSRPRGKMYTATREQPTAGSTSNYSALLLFGRNLVILLQNISARLMNN